MKVLNVVYLLSFLLTGTFGVSCSNDDDSDDSSSNGTGGDSDDDGGVDGDFEDSESETGTGEGEDTGTGDPCGEDGQRCCMIGDACVEGLSGSMSFLDAQCYCRPECTFHECTAGSEQGYCSPITGSSPSANACVQPVDFESDPSDCTEGDPCETLSGDPDGICISMFSSDFTTMLNRCVVPCDNLPTECEAPLVCTPEMYFRNDGILYSDYEIAHCLAGMM